MWYRPRMVSPCRFGFIKRPPCADLNVDEKIFQKGFIRWWGEESLRVLGTPVLTTFDGGCANQASEPRCLMHRLKGKFLVAISHQVLPIAVNSQFAT